VLAAGFRQGMPGVGEPRLAAAMGDLLARPGSLVRAVVAYLVGIEMGMLEESARAVACGIEYLHTASLVFDDLPAMDDARTRRGAPCLHVVHGEAMAMLAGLALVNRGYSLLWQGMRGAPLARREEAGHLVDECLGMNGVIGGQAYDLFFSNVPVTLVDELEKQPFVKEAQPVLFAIVTAPDRPVVTCFGIRAEDGRLKKAGWLSGSAASFRDDGEDVVLGERAADFLKAKAGDEVELGQGKHKVAGVVRMENGFENGGVFMPLASCQKAFHKEGFSSVVTVTLADGHDSSEVKKWINSEHPKMTALENEEFSRSYSQFKIIKTTAWVVGGCAFLLGGLSVTNTMILSVFSRIKEIAIARVCGFSRAQVAGMIFGESLAVCAFGILGGWLLSMGGLHLLQTIPQLQGYIEPNIGWQELSGAAALAVGTALAVALYFGRRRWPSAVALGSVVALASATTASPRSEATAVERGRAVYLAEGCIHCHSRYVRPGSPDVEMWGPASDPAEVLKEKPVLIGNRRQGPDLANVGARRSKAWLKLHFFQPRDFSAGSPMPSYAHLFRDIRGDDLIAFLRDVPAEAHQSRAVAALAWKPTATAAIPDGTALYHRHCATCHGPVGHGDGKLAPLLAKTPVNLDLGPFIWTPDGPDLETRQACGTGYHHLSSGSACSSIFSPTRWRNFPVASAALSRPASVFSFAVLRPSSVFSPAT
jgi:putative ABC transport system permease protein